MSEDIRPGYPTVRATRGRLGGVLHIEDPVFARKLVALAATGMSRRGVCRRAGCDPKSLRTWLDRGEACPNEEPYGSFSRDYLDAERLLEEAGSNAEMNRVQWLVEQQQALMQWVPEFNEAGFCTNKPEVATKDFEWLLKLKASRYPLDHGTHALRQPELDPSGEAWLERTGMQSEQLQTLLADPPEIVRDALATVVKAALANTSSVLHVLMLESGWAPNEAVLRQGR